MVTKLVIPVYRHKSPLDWPGGWPREHGWKSSPWRIEPVKAKKEMLLELGAMGATDIVISSNQRANADGSLSIARQTIFDTGVAVYFTRKGKPIVLACDQYPEVHDNVRAIGKTLQAMRGIERWGASDLLDRAFTGFLALPAPEQYWQVLGVSSSASEREITAAYRELARELQARGAEQWEWTRLNTARDAAKAARS